jgi:hypothetical protein
VGRTAFPHNYALPPPCRRPHLPHVRHDRIATTRRSKEGARQPSYRERERRDGNSREHRVGRTKDVADAGDDGHEEATDGADDGVDARADGRDDVSP